jgi:hypothetical protein
MCDKYAEYRAQKKNASREIKPTKNQEGNVAHISNPNSMNEVEETAYHVD